MILAKPSLIAKCCSQNVKICCFVMTKKNILMHNYKSRTLLTHTGKEPVTNLTDDLSSSSTLTREH
jgi:hypothetical protein